MFSEFWNNFESFLVELFPLWKRHHFIFTNQISAAWTTRLVKDAVSYNKARVICSSMTEKFSWNLRKKYARIKERKTAHKLAWEYMTTPSRGVGDCVCQHCSFIRYFTESVFSCWVWFIRAFMYEPRRIFSTTFYFLNDTLWLFSRLSNTKNKSQLIQLIGSSLKKKNCSVVHSLEDADVDIAAHACKLTLTRNVTVVG